MGEGEVPAGDVYLDAVAEGDLGVASDVDVGLAEAGADVDEAGGGVQVLSGAKR